MGGVFVAVEGARRPVYSAGPPKGAHNLVLFTCPVSGLPPEVWDLLVLWWNCRLMKCLPFAGGFLDQPVTVRDSFPIFEAQFRGVEAVHGQDGAMQAAQVAVLGMVAAMAGRR